MSDHRKGGVSKPNMVLVSMNDAVCTSIVAGPLVTCALVAQAALPFFEAKW